MIKRVIIRGTTVVEAMVALAVFSLFASVIYTSFVTAQALQHRSANRSEAYWLSEEGIEAARSLRDQGFTNIPAGTYGITKASSSWAFSGTSDITNGFTRQVQLGTIDTDSRYATSTVSWVERGTTYSAKLTTILTNWHKIGATGATATTIDTSSACVYTLDQRYLSGVRLVNDGSAGATSVTAINIAWTPTSQSLTQIYAPYPTSVWSGSVATGATTTLTTPISFSGAGNVTTTFMWGGLVGNKTFTIKYIFADGSTKSTTISPALITICL